MKTNKPRVNEVKTDEELENISILKSVKAGRKTPKVSENEVSKILRKNHKITTERKLFT